MNPYLLGAAALTVLTLLVHAFLGGPEYHSVYQSSLATAHLTSMAGVLWHAVTVSLAVFAVARIAMARQPNLPLALTLSAVDLGWAGLFLYYGITQLGSVWPMAQWVIFLLLAMLTMLGHRRRT